MKKGELLIVALGLAVLLAAGAFSVTAVPSQTSPCGNCHTATGVLVLTSNATGTVDATVGVPFALMVSQTGYSAGDGKVAIAIRSGWSDNAQFSFTEQSVEDGDGSDLNPATDQVTVLLTLTPTTAGSWTVRIWSAGKEGMVGTSLDISVSVSDSPTTTTTTTTSTTTTTTSTTTTTTSTTTSSTTTTSTTTTTTTTDTGTTSSTQPGDSTLMTVAIAGIGAIIIVIIIAYAMKRGG